MIIKKTLAEHYYLTTKAPLRDEHDHIIELINITTNITKKKQAQHELEKLILAEQQLHAKTEHANHTKNKFLTIISHKLHSPLNALHN